MRTGVHSHPGTHVFVPSAGGQACSTSIRCGAARESPHGREAQYKKSKPTQFKPQPQPRLKSRDNRGSLLDKRTGERDQIRWAGLRTRCIGKALLRAIWQYTRACHLAAHEWQWCLFQNGHVKAPEKPFALPDTALTTAHRQQKVGDTHTSISGEHRTGQWTAHINLCLQRTATTTYFDLSQTPVSATP